MNRHLLLALGWLTAFVGLCFLWFSPAELGWFIAGFFRLESPGHDSIVSSFIYDIGSFARFAAALVTLVLCFAFTIHHLFESLRR